MITFTWKTLDIYDECKSVRYLLTATDGANTVESEGNITFSEGTVNKPFSEIVESDIVQWLEKETTKNDVNPIKLNLENQLNSIGMYKKMDLPWLAGTFTIE